MKHLKHGFNLIEMSIALVVVAIGVLSVAALFPSQLEMVRDGMNRSAASNFAHQVDASTRAMAASTNIIELTNAAGGNEIIPLLQTPDNAYATHVMVWTDSDGIPAPPAAPSPASPTPPGTVVTTLVADDVIKEIHLWKKGGGLNARREASMYYQFRIAPRPGLATVLGVQLTIWPNYWPGRTPAAGDEDAEVFATEVYFTGTP